jgi:MFS family permease
MSAVEKTAKQNRLLAYAMTILENASFSLPIWLLFYTRQLGLNVTAAIALSMTRWISMAICNIPTGAWADRYGRVKIYRYGQFIYALSLLPFVFTRSLPILVAAQIIGGFTGSMTIGTLQPLVKDGHELADLPAKHYKNYLSTDTALLYSSRVLAGVLGAWLYSRFPKGPYILEFAVLFAAFLVSLFLRELRVEKSAESTNRKHMSEALRYIWQNSYLRSFFAVMLLAIVATESLWTGLQPIFVLRTIQPEYFGLLFGVVATLSACSSMLSRHLPDSVGGIRLFTYYMGLAVVGVGLIQFASVWLTVLALVPLGFAFGFFQPTKYATIQKRTSSKYQSTVLSAASLTSMMFYGTVSILVGRYIDAFGTRTMLTIISIQAVVCTSITFIIAWFQQGLPANKISSAIIKDNV